jgi:acyl-CoA synthetase (NDP forming)
MDQLDHMLKARSVAVVGASARPGSVGEVTLRQLVTSGFEGPVYPVNPGHQSLMGLLAHPNIGDIGEPVDLAVLAVANTRLEEETEKALRAGARSLAIFASCHGQARDGAPLRERITSLAGAAGVRICGGNGMGFLNLDERLWVCGFFQPPDIVPGGTTFLSHSGSLFSAMLHNRRRIGFNLVVSTGLELNTTMADYLSGAIGLETTRVVALFMETVRDPSGFLTALEEARERSIPVIALKVGATRRGREAVATHSEAIAGDDAAYEAVFDRHSVHRVESMDEMIDTIELMSSPRTVVRGGLGAVHDSGGERALLIDTAERTGVPLPTITEATASRFAGLLDPGLEPANPVDAWGTGHEAEKVFIGCLEALAADPGIGVVALSVDLTREEEPANAYGLAALEAAARTDKPLLVLANLSATVDPVQAAVIREGGVPVLEGTETGLRAIRHLMDRAEWLDRPSPQPRITSPSDWPRGEHRAEEILVGYGIPVARSREAGNRGEAIEAANSLGYPVVMKTVGVDHKMEVAGVILDLVDEEQVARAYDDLSSRLGAKVMVSEQIGPGVELALGMIRDPQFGPVVLISAGGTLIELLRDSVALLPPLDQAGARRALDRLAMAPMLGGHRGAPPVDMACLAAIVARFSELAIDAPADIASIDVNPLIATADSTSAVDVLIKTAP